MEYITNMVVVGMDNQSRFDADDFTKGMENFAFFEFEREESEIPLKSIPQYAQYGIVAAICFSLIIGSYFKYVYYGRILETGLSVKEHAVNVMLLYGSVIQHIKQVLGAIFYVLVICSNVKLGQVFGTTFCETVGIFTTIVGAHLFAGNLMIAIFRLLYIKCNHWVKYKAGVGTVFVILFGGGFLISAGLTIFLHANVTNGSGRIIYNACMGHSEAFADILYGYKNPMGK